MAGFKTVIARYLVCTHTPKPISWFTVTREIVSEYLATTVKACARFNPLLIVITVLLSSLIFTNYCSAEENSPQMIRIATVQFQSTADLKDNVKRICSYIQLAGKDGVKMMAFPECAVTGYRKDYIESATESDLLKAERRLQTACKRANVAAVIGTPYFKNGILYNTALAINESGETVDRYDKMQLAGETWCQPGQCLSFFKFHGIPCATIICHDERYPELVRLPVLKGAQIIFYVSSESGLLSESKIIPYRSQISARAAENCVYIIHANTPADPTTKETLNNSSHGQSRLIAPDGNIIDEAPMFGEKMLTADIDLNKATRTNAKNSLRSDLLRQWWENGLKLMEQNK